MSLNETDISNGVSVSGSTNPFNTYIKTVNAGVYDIQFSAQVEKTDSGTDEIVIWLRKNGTDLTDTATTITLSGNNAKQVAAWNWFVASAANDYYQIIWVSADTGMRLLAETISATHPGIPSVIGGAKDTITGERQNFIGSVEQLVDQEFLDKLISVKAKGATFGALTDREGEALRNSATKINKWRILDNNDRTTGYNISEKEFKKELEKSQNLSGN
jgi:hypothetical protein